MLFYLSFPVLSTSVPPTHKTALLRVTGPLAHSTNSDPDPIFFFFFVLLCSLKVAAAGNFSTKLRSVWSQKAVITVPLWELQVSGVGVLPQRKEVAVSCRTLVNIL